MVITALSLAVPRFGRYETRLAEALALLGQSRIANNLNQLAHQANIGTLVMEDRERAKIDEAYSYILSLRTLLVAALGRDR